MPRRRTFITGVGVVSPHGDNLDEVFDRVFAGESSVRKVPIEANGSSCDMLLSPVDFEPDPLIPKVSGRFMARATKMAVVAARAAAVLIQRVRMFMLRPLITTTSRLKYRSLL